MDKQEIEHDINEYLNEDMEEVYRKAINVIEKESFKDELDESSIIKCLKKKSIDIVNYAFMIKIHIGDLISYFYNKVIPYLVKPKEWTILTAYEKDNNGTLIKMHDELNRDYVLNYLEKNKDENKDEQLWINYTYLDDSYIIINPKDFPFPVIDEGRDGSRLQVIFAEDDLGNDLTELCKKVMGPNGDFYKGEGIKIYVKHLTRGQKIMIMFDDGREIEFTDVIKIDL